MRTISGVAVSLSLYMSLGGCAGGQVTAPDEAVTYGHSSREALDWPGTYSGVLPCASCPGIKTSVTLNADGSYERSLLYIDEQPIPRSSSGTFSWDEAGRIVTLAGEGDEAQQYQVGEHVLFHLDRDGQRIEGELAASYLLHQHLSDPRVEDRRWILVELRGQPVAVPETGRAPFMMLGREDSRVNGNASCNAFNGPYAIKSGNRIEFARHMAVTMMACPDMSVETQFLEILGMADNYSVGEDGMLSLNRARMAPLARFVAAEEPLPVLDLR
jgi:copper homeostasis protein (lipoprotein)